MRGGGRKGRREIGRRGRRGREKARERESERARERESESDNERERSRCVGPDAPAMLTPPPPRGQVCCTGEDDEDIGTPCVRFKFRC